MRERERLLDKRQEMLEQQADELRKQEKIVESTQRKLTERIEDANRRKDELAKLLDLQRQTLHELSGLSRDEATAEAAGGLAGTSSSRKPVRSSSATNAGCRRRASRSRARSC